MNGQLQEKFIICRHYTRILSYSSVYKMIFYSVLNGKPRKRTHLPADQMTVLLRNCVWSEPEMAYRHVLYFLWQKLNGDNVNDLFYIYSNMGVKQMFIWPNLTSIWQCHKLQLDSFTEPSIEIMPKIIVSIWFII